MSADLTEEERADARNIFEGKVEGQRACMWCAGIHAHVADLEPHWQPCPRIKRIERNADGAVLTIEHWPPGTWDDDVIFPADVYTDDA